MDSTDKERIVSILESVVDMTIATIREDGYPQANTVSYVNDGLLLYFGTGRHSQKAKNIVLNNKVSLTINKPYHFWNDIVGLSISGRAHVVSIAAEYRKIGKLLHERFPQVNEFSNTGSEETQLIRIDPEYISLLDYKKGIGQSQTFSNLEITEHG